MTIIAAADIWDVDDGTDDPWYAQPYRWTARLKITRQPHSSHLTPTPFSYGATDVRVGDWFADLQTARALRLHNIVSILGDTVIAIVEDSERYNTFCDPTGSGIAYNEGAGYVFTLGTDGLPILGPLSSRVAVTASFSNFESDLLSRFRYRNTIQNSYAVRQKDHGFQVGNLICLTANGYVRALGDASVSAIAGCVSDVGIPGPEWFDYTPVGRVILDVGFDLPGGSGALIYLTPTGSLTTVRPAAFARPVFLRLETARRAIFLDRGVEGVGPDGYTTNSSIVQSPNDRDAIPNPNSGDHVFVQDVGNGEWGMYIFSQDNGWTLVATQDAAAASPGSRTLLVAAQSPDSGEFARIEYGTRIVEISVDVLEPFNGKASFMVYNDADETILHQEIENDLSVSGRYTSNPAYYFTVGSECRVMYNITRSGTTTGLLRVSISYI